MPSSVHPSLADSHDRDWEVVEAFIAQIAELSQRDISLDEFAGELLQRTLSLLSAGGGAIWLQHAPNRLTIQCERHLEIDDSPEGSQRAAAHAEFVQTIMSSREPQVRRATPGRSTNASNATWIGAPILYDGQVIGVFEIIQRPIISADIEQGNQRLLGIVGEQTADFLRRCELRDLRQSQSAWQHYEQLAQQVHASLDLRHTAYALVNGGRGLLECDRVSLVIPRQRDWRVAAISGVDTCDRRAPTVKLLESLAKAVAGSQQTLRFQGDTSQLPPQLAAPVSAYVDESHARELLVIPLPLSSQVPGLPESGLVGVLIVEQFDATLDDVSNQQLDRVTQLASAAIQNALVHESLPLRSVANLVRQASVWARRHVSKLVLTLCGVLIVLLSLIFIPGRFYIRAEGELQPKVRQDIFSPLDAEVVEVLCKHDDYVEQGQILLELRSRETELELQRLLGEYQTTEKKLLALASARLQSADDSSQSRIYPGQLAAEEQELKQLLSSQQQQLSLVRQQRDQLTVRSPIQGRVLTWDPDKVLSDRPVQRGQLLISTADVNGPWVLLLRVPERHAAHVLAAERVSDEPVNVVFTLASNRLVKYQAHTVQIAVRTENLQPEQAHVRILASVLDPDAQLLRPGASVYARIDCGSKPIGFVWLHDIIDTLRGWLFF